MTISKQTNVIYGLRVSEEGSAYRYIGLTSGALHKRFTSHKSSAYTKNTQTPVYHWMRKHEGEILCEIIEECSTEDFEFLVEREKYWIATYRLHYGSLEDHTTEDYLLNVSDGGDGTPGVPWTDERRESYSKMFSGEGNPMYGVARSEESKQKQSESISGEKHWNYGNNWSDEYKEKQRVAHLGQTSWCKGLKLGPISDDHKRRISEANTGSKRTEETKARMSKAQKGLKVSDEGRANISAAAKNRPKFPCPHCDMVGTMSNMSRWHFDNCKLKV